MRMFSKLGIAIVASVAVSAACSAQAAPMTYGCDTPSDRFSSIKQSVQTRSFTVRGNIQPVLFRKGEYPPSAQVYLESADDQNRFALQIIAEKQMKAARVFLEITADGESSGQFLIGSVALLESVNFQISVTNGSKINFAVDELKGSPELPLGDQANLNITCSTGEFVFSDLEWMEK